MLLARHAQGLLPFIGEGRPGVRLTAVERVVLSVANRPVDSVLRLERDGLVWYRHLEFQAEPDLDIPRRCFEHNSSLILHYGAPVFTTVVYLLPGADKDVPDAFRLYLGDRLAYEWRFDVVRLWEIDAKSALESGEAGPLGLVPLLRGLDEPSKVVEAVRMLKALPTLQAAQPLSVLLQFAALRWDRASLLSLLGEDRAAQSWIYQMGVEEGEVRAQAKGRIRVARETCADMARECHPAVAADVVPTIEACDQPETLHAWTLQCPKLSSGAFLALVTGKPPARPARSRASRPSRRSTKRR